MASPEYDTDSQDRSWWGINAFQKLKVGRWDNVSLIKKNLSVVTGLWPENCNLDQFIMIL